MENSIVVLKLSSGEMVIGTQVENNESILGNNFEVPMVLSDVLSILLQRKGETEVGVAFAPYMMFAEDKHYFMPSGVISVAAPSTQLKNEYTRLTTGIEIATSIPR